MGPRGGFPLLHLIGGMICLALFMAAMSVLLFLAVGIARKKGWLPKRPFGPGGPGHHGPGGHGPRHEPGAPPHAPGPHEALRILDERLARSEIEIDDYKARRDALTGNSFPPFQQPPHSPHTPPHGPGPHTPPAGPGAPEHDGPPPMPTVPDHPAAPPHPEAPDPDAPRPPQSPD